MAELAPVEFAENPEPRCPCVLLLDTSGSMAGAPLNALNEGLATFSASLAKDRLASLRVEVAVVTFDSKVSVLQDFVTADEFTPPLLQANGLTDMAGGIEKALDLIEARKSEYKQNHISYYRPWVFMITDGEPNDGYEAAAQRLRAAETNKRVAFFAVGVEGADMHKLAQITVRTPLKLIGLNFKEMFEWLSVSMKSVSHSKTDEQIPLSPAGWGLV